MSLIEIFQLATSTGVLTGGIGLLKWALRIERRMMVVEVKNGIDPSKS